jgi:hypothetical protein
MADIELPRPFAFDEFYAMLKKYVNDPKAREALANYDAEAIEGRGQLDDSSTSSELAYDADGIFQQIGWSILVRARRRSNASNLVGSILDRAGSA